MAKATLEFTLPEEADAHRVAADGHKWRDLVMEFDEQELRLIARGKAECPWATGAEAVSALRDSLYQMLSDAGLSMWE